MACASTSQSSRKSANRKMLAKASRPSTQRPADPARAAHRIGADGQVFGRLLPASAPLAALASRMASKCRALLCPPDWVKAVSRTSVRSGSVHRLALARCCDEVAAIAPGACCSVAVRADRACRHRLARAAARRARSISRARASSGSSAAELHAPVTIGALRVTLLPLRVEADGVSRRRRRGTGARAARHHRAAAAHQPATDASGCRCHGRQRFVDVPRWIALLERRPPRPPSLLPPF